LDIKVVQTSINTGFLRSLKRLLENSTFRKSDFMNNIPTPLEVKNIFKDTYLYYLKFINSSSESDYQLMRDEGKALYEKYPFQLCKDILMDSQIVIEGSKK
jgi:hypothetical protein